LQEKIEALEDLVQSVEIIGFNKIWYKSNNCTSLV
jgi:hypothetical protein